MLQVQKETGSTTRVDAGIGKENGICAINIPLCNKYLDDVLTLKDLLTLDKT